MNSSVATSAIIPGLLERQEASDKRQKKRPETGARSNWSGTAKIAGDGYFQVTLDTSGLETGANKLEVALVSKAASIPSFASVEFLTVP